MRMQNLDLPVSYQQRFVEAFVVFLTRWEL